MKIKIKIVIIFFSAFLIFSCGTEPDSNKYQNDNIPELNNGNDDIDTFSEQNDKPEKKRQTLSENETASPALFYVLVTFSAIFILLVPVFFVFFVPLGLWYKAFLSDIRPGWWNLTKMRLQSIPQPLIIDIMIKAGNSGLKLNTEDLMKKYLANVDIIKVTDTAIRALNGGIDISYNELATQYLAKVDVETVMHALITAHNAGMPVGLKELSGHYLAHVDVIQVVEGLITAHNAGYDEFTLTDLKEHYLANGNVPKTVDAFIAAKEADFDKVTFDDIASIDLAGMDVEKVVDSAVNPFVVETSTVVGVASDGVQILMKLKLTLRANLKNVIGGAKQDTVLARVDESLATEIGRAKCHLDILESPFELADRVEKKNLGDDTAFDIISVDVSEIKIGKDVHAELEKERASAKSETAKADLIVAEEKVQRAMASAFMDGKLSIKDYNEILNTEADTHMRRKLGDSAEEKTFEEDEHHDDFEDNI